MGSQDRNLKVQIDRISIGRLDRGPRPSIDAVFDATDLVEGNVVLRPRGVSIRECLNRSPTAEGIRIELGIETTGTFKFERNVQDVEDAVVVRVFPTDLRKGRFG